MTTSDVSDAVLFAKLSDNRIFQVCLSKEMSLQVVRYAADLTGTLKLLNKESVLEWDRLEYIKHNCNEIEP